MQLDSHISVYRISSTSFIPLAVKKKAATEKCDFEQT